MNWLWVLMALLSCEVGGETCVGGGLFNDDIHKCFHFLAVPLTASESIDICTAVGGTLVTIHNAFVQTLLFGNARQRFSNVDYWIGLSYEQQTDSWLWSDGISSNYSYWAPGFPLRNDTLKCVAIQIGTGRWYNKECDTQTEDFICETDMEYSAIGDCVGGSFYLGRCFYLMGLRRQYSDAALICGSLQGFLPNVDSAAKQTFIFEEVKKHEMLSDYWIGLSEHFDNGSWQWSNSSDVSYTNWEDGFPINGADFECVAVTSLSGRWYNTMCNCNENMFVCETEAWNGASIAPHTTHRTTTFSVEPSLIPDQWIYFPSTDSWYKAIYEESVIWDYYESRCKGESSELVSVHSKEENDFVQSVLHSTEAWMNYYCWLGFRSTSSVSSNFTWTDSSPVDYTNWAAGNPRPSDYCALMISNGRWQSFDCEQPFYNIGAVCKKKIS